MFNTLASQYINCHSKCPQRLCKSTIFFQEAEKQIELEIEKQDEEEFEAEERRIAEELASG